MPLLHDLVKAGHDVERVAELLRAGENPNCRNHLDNTPLHFVALRNEINLRRLYENLQLAKELLRFGANVDAKNTFGETPLMYAVQARNRGMTEFLLQENAQIDATDNKGNTALHYANLQDRFTLLKGNKVIRNLDLHLTRTLLRYNPEIDRMNYQHQFPLMIAVNNQQLRVVQELLKHNASVNLLGPNNRSVIHEALDQENVDVDIVLELMRHDCQFNVRCLNDFSPMNVYMRRLSKASTDELEKAKKVFKYFLFLQNCFTTFDLQEIERISRKRSCQFSQFIQYCQNEILQMLRDKLSPKYSVYDIATLGFYGRSDSNVPMEVFDTLLNKLINSEYPVYCDLIVSGIGSPYLNSKFAEICYYVLNTGRGFSKFDVFYLISFYLSHLDMLKMMIACL